MNNMADGTKSPEELLAEYSSGVTSGEVAKQNQELFKKPKKVRPTEFSRLPVHRVKDAGQPTSKSGFPKGSVGTGGSWSPD